jgi:hypothetical protein
MDAAATARQNARGRALRRESLSRRPTTIAMRRMPIEMIIHLVRSTVRAVEKPVTRAAWQK